ncbi:CAP domain-containing protein [Roseomonas sp. E05]|uniref:CAP domain-containing protein n=1 Tax=Roseomonas sp. E05 TaxID=3046310 RepID=UPI0024B9FA1A|nr:CAP domain-containing protein [Roseomonas sp. E05]MDJ0389516.1 CAP domain-containing protein [Roseomonas sp. E05]
MARRGQDGRTIRVAWPPRKAGRVLLAAFVLLLAGRQPLRAAEDGDLGALRQRALELVNQARAAEGLARLEEGGSLDEAAQSHARDMLRRHYYAHTSPEGENVRDRYMAAGGGRWELVEENIARCRQCAPPATAETVARLQEGWMNSPEHRENILREGLSRFGFGIVVEAGQGLYAVQTFAGPGTSREAGGDAAPASLSAGDAAAQAARLVNQARSKAGLGEVHASPALSEAARALLPDPASDGLTLPQGDGLLEAVPPAQRSRWHALSVLAGACGGCGTQPTGADLRHFTRQWLDDPQQRQRLLAPDVTGIGAALQANGTGRKVALIVLGTGG